MHEQCLCDGVGKTADQFQSYDQEGGTLLVLSVVLPCLQGQFRRLFVSELLRCVRQGSHQGNFQMSQTEPKRCCSDMEEVRDTGAVDDVRRSGRTEAITAVDNRYVRISARRNPESNATMLNNAFLCSHRTSCFDSNCTK